MSLFHRPKRREYQQLEDLSEWHQYQKVGTYRRWYDTITAPITDEEKEAPEFSEKGRDTIRKVLSWLREDVTEYWPLSDRDEGPFGVSKKLPGLLRTFFFGDLFTVLDTFYYGLRDIWERRRIRSTLTIWLCALLGVAGGGTLGGAWVPVIGGYFGVVLIGQIGGIAALCVLGALGGRWVGKKLAKLWFYEERQFELSHKIMARWAPYSLPKRAVLLMNAYLLNRNEAVQDEVVKRYYDRLRREGIKKVKTRAVALLTRFFCCELSLLEEAEERSEDYLGEEWLREKESVIQILRFLEYSPGVLEKSKDRIEQTLKKRLEEKPSMEKESPGITLETSHSFFRYFKSVPMKSIPMIQEEEFYGYSLMQGENAMIMVRGKEKEIEVIFQEKRSQKESFPGEVWRLELEKILLEEESEPAIAAALMTALKQAIYELKSEGRQTLLVRSATNETLAAHLMEVAVNENFDPRLEEGEDLSEKKRKSLLLI